MRNNILAVSIAAVGMLLVSAPLVAHHGAAALDTGKEVTLKGTVTEWIWSNPHCFLQFDAKDDAGTVRCIASVVWAKYEIPKGTSPRYRVGLEFIDPDGAALDGFIRRHKQE